MVREGGGRRERERGRERDCGESRGIEKERYLILTGLNFHANAEIHVGVK